MFLRNKMLFKSYITEMNKPCSKIQIIDISIELKHVVFGRATEVEICS